LSEEWKESIIVPMYKKSDKTGCSNYRVTPFLSTAYKIVSINLMSMLTQHAEKSFWR